MATLLQLLFQAAIFVSLTTSSIETTVSGVMFRANSAFSNSLKSSATNGDVTVNVSTMEQCAIRCLTWTSCLAFNVQPLRHSNSTSEDYWLDDLSCVMIVDLGRGAVINRPKMDSLYYEMDCSSIIERQGASSVASKYCSERASTNNIQIQFGQKLLINQLLTNHDNVKLGCINMAMNSTEVIIRNQDQQDVVDNFLLSQGKSNTRYWIGVVKLDGSSTLTYFDGTDLVSYQPWSTPITSDCLRAYIQFNSPRKWICEYDHYVEYPAICIQGGN